MTKNRKKGLTIGLSLLLVIAIAIGGTLAYLSSRTETEENVFTFAPNIKATLTEPGWDPNEALDLVPGKEIEKDPQITNTSENGVTENAAIKLTWLDGAGNLIDDSEKRDIDGNADENGMTDMARLMSLIEIDWSGNWTLEDGTTVSAEQIYVYDKALPQGVTSDPIFYSITIPDDITSEELAWLAGNYAHENACYQAGAHDDAECTSSYWHHERCALRDGVNAEADIALTEAGETLGAQTCDCSAVEVHESECPSLIKTLIDKDCHTTIISGLGNFTIKVEGAVVQADTFETDAAMVDALIALFA